MSMCLKSSFVCALSVFFLVLVFVPLLRRHTPLDWAPSPQSTLFPTAQVLIKQYYKKPIRNKI